MTPGLARIQNGYTLCMMPQNRTRSQTLVLRLNEDERGMIEALADAMGLKLSDTLRQCIRAEAKRRGIEIASVRKRGRT